MKLKYSILWFDDDVDQIQSHDFDHLAETINSWGFEFDGPDIVDTPKNFMERAPFQDFDLIVVDYNLGDDEEYGDTFVKYLRNHNIYTDVVFYTGGNTTDLWEAVKNKKLEGVFLSNVTDIITKVIRVAKQSVKKIVDLENMRGIVMAQVGDLDHSLKQFITHAFMQLEKSHQEYIYKKFIKNGQSRGKKISKEFDDFQCVPTVEGMLGLCDSSFPIFGLSKSLIKRHPMLKEFDISDYEEEVLKPRNALAHGVPYMSERGGYKFSHRGYEFEYTDVSALKIRSDLKKYRTTFEELLEATQKSESP